VCTTQHRGSAFPKKAQPKRGEDTGRGDGTSSRPSGSPEGGDQEDTVADIREHMKIIGKDGAHVGTVDRVEGHRIKLTKKDSPSGHQGHHHYIDLQLVGAVEGDIVKLSCNADSIPEQEASGQKA
jgi:hypothetical protein